MSTELYAEVTFHITGDLDLDALKAKAREADEENGAEPPDDYTLTQAVQVVWHQDPAWLHKHVLAGWTMDKAVDEDGNMKPVWPEKS